MPLHIMKAKCESCGETFTSVRNERPRMTNDAKHHPARYCTACARSRCGWKKNETTRRSRKPGAVDT